MPALHRSSIAILAAAHDKGKGSISKRHGDSNDNDDNISEISFYSDDVDNDNRNTITPVLSSSSVVSSSTASTKRSNSIYKRVKKKDTNDDDDDDSNKDGKDTSLSSSIHIACYKGNVRAVRAFIATDGDKVNDPIKFLPYQLISQYERRDPKYKPPPSLPILVKDSIDTALDNGVMQLSLDQRWILSRMFNNSTLLHYACLANQADIVKLLLQNGADKTILNDSKNHAAHYCSNSSIISMIDVSLKVPPPPKKLSYTAKQVDTDSVRKGLISIKTLMEEKKKKMTESKKGVSTKSVSSSSGRNNNINSATENSGNSGSSANSNSVNNSTNSIANSTKNDNNNDNDNNKQNEDNNEKYQRPRPIQIPSAPPPPPPPARIPPPPPPLPSTITKPSPSPSPQKPYIFSPKYDHLVKEEKRRENEELRELKRKEEADKAERDRVEKLQIAFLEAKKKEESNHARFIEKIYISLRPLDIPDLPDLPNPDPYNDREVREARRIDTTSDDIKLKISAKVKKAVTRSERIWQTALCSDTSYTRDIEKLKFTTYEYGKKKFIEEFRDLAYDDWTISRRSSRSSSVPRNMTLRS